MSGTLAGLLTWSWLLLTLVGVADTSGAERVEITLVGNAGFVIRTAGHAAIIDGLLEPAETNADEFRVYPPGALLASLLRQGSAGPPIELALVTHDHLDHLDPGVAASFLRTHPDARLVAPREALQSIAGVSRSRTVAQLIDLPSAAAVHRVDWPGGRVTVLPTRHSGFPAGVVANFVFVLEIEGVRVLHLGDAPYEAATFSTFEPGELDVDVAFVSSWYITNAEGRQLVTDLFRPRHVVLMHLPRGRAAEAAGWVSDLTASGGEFPSVAILEDPGDSVILSF